MTIVGKVLMRIEKIRAEESEKDGNEENEDIQQDVVVISHRDD